MNSQILLIEDEPGLVLTLTDRLKNEGYKVESARDGISGFKMGLEGTYDLILLDVMLPGKNGFDLCRELRQQQIATPILMLTARGQVADKVVGLKLGADDYLAKPFDMLELLARIEALLRRTPPQALVQEHYHFASVDVDFKSGEVRKEGKLVELSAKEYQLLCYLIQHRGVIPTRSQLLDDVWGYDATPFTRTVDVHIAWLRQKLEDHPRNPQYILTLHRQGYKFSG